MDYILSQINRKINYYENRGDALNAREHLRSRIEYLIILIFSYLWNKNFFKLDDDTKESILPDIFQPSIGNIIDMSRKLDLDMEIFNNRKLKESLNYYPQFRNNFIGHGFIYEDNIIDVNSNLKTMYDKIINSGNDFINKNISLVLITDLYNNIYRGTRYEYNGNGYSAVNIPKNIQDMEVGCLYGSNNINSYFKLSPFIELVSENEYYIFSRMQERLTGKFKYIRLTYSGYIFREWDFLTLLSKHEDSNKKRCGNGTIINIFEKNYNKYIDIGVKEKIIRFLKTDRSSVCATIWGHGGVGKTATVQSACEDLTIGSKHFDYIVFLSAKDRRYNVLTGTLEEIKDRVSHFNEIILKLNYLLFNENNDDIKNIIKFPGKMLLIIDDFETFDEEDKNMIREFILKLDINIHKVLITTRANLIIGQEIQTNELNEDETERFLLEVIKIEVPNFYESIKNKLLNSDLLHKVYEITSGRPIFIFQLAFIIGQLGNLENALKIEIRDTQSAKSFLYGRIYDNYLSRVGRNLFVAMSLLCKRDDLTSLVDRVKYILNMEDEENEFNSALNELVKLKIIKVDSDNRFFEIYSPEILQIMHDYFQRTYENFKEMCYKRLSQVNRDKSLDIDQTLLLNANQSRLTKNEAAVISSYRQILNRVNTNDNIKMQAALNLAAYLIDIGKRIDALELLSNYLITFSNSPLFIKRIGVYYWGNGTNEEKKKGKEILCEYFTKYKTQLTDSNLEIAGLALMYSSILIINEWHEVSNKRRFSEINKTDYENIRKRQRKECLNIYNNLGTYLFSKIERIKIDELSTGARSNLVNGMYQFVDICIFIEKLQFGRMICEFLLYYAPYQSRNQFQRKIEKIDYIVYKRQRKNN
jgi:hypothetical protein